MRTAHRGRNEAIKSSIIDLTFAFTVQPEIARHAPGCSHFGAPASDELSQLGTKEREQSVLAPADMIGTSRSASDYGLGADREGVTSVLGCIAASSAKLAER